MFNKYVHKKLIGLILAVIWISCSSYGQYATADSEKLNTGTTFSKTLPLKVGTIKERPVGETLLSKLKNDEAFWYANLKPQRQKRTERLPFWLSILQQSWFRSFIWLFITISFTIVLLWYLAISDVKLFRKTPKRIEDPTEEVLPMDIFSINYPLEIQNAVGSNNFRLAVRLLFLKTLKELAERGMIQYEINRTNSDYVMQLTSTPFHNEFSRLTQNFEYVWYGKMDVPPPAYERMQSDYENFHQRLPH